MGRSRHRPASKVRTPTAGVVSGRNKTGEKRALALASVLMPLTLLTPAGFTSCHGAGTQPALFSAKSLVPST